MVHQLHVDLDHQLVRQERSKFALERNEIINEEVQKLLNIRLACEVHYPNWLANIVIVCNKNGKWRVYIDFIDLNKACPKRFLPFPTH